MVYWECGEKKISAIGNIVKNVGKIKRMDNQEKQELAQNLGILEN